ncbi:DUF2218 domain-containing protein [Roseomonas sp. NAR14]|uniref:DUF2218 domain-containing protein n=1 Tax=Roseomonas acroporae TaxID=2937791 RepID=A0A9X1Y406_9PROT|nr:DUF2218 domain-containing protein [Roseomonas acroporae]MCK8783784.1 DUF2218 domain-containing protein [Roseomonas acroporae]
MSNSTARVATALPRRYMGQLCKHFEHKLAVQLEEEAGRIEFPMGVCLLRAEPETLVMRAEAADAEALAKLEDVVARHLVRFMFREPVTVDWVREAG